MEDDSRVAETVPAKRRKPGRPLGAKTKRTPPGEPLRGARLREVIARAITPEKLEAILKKLSPAETARLLVSLEPKMREESPVSNFSLHVYGLRGGVCKHCGKREDQEDPPAKAEEVPSREAGLRLIGTAGSSSRRSWEGEQ